MLLLIQLCLTVCAAARGWRWWAVVPMLSLMIGAYAIGFVGGFVTGSPNPLDIMPLWAWASMDIVCAVALVAMCVAAPEGDADRVGTRIGTRVGTRIGTEINA